MGSTSEASASTELWGSFSWGQWQHLCPLSLLQYQLFSLLVYFHWHSNMHQNLLFKTKWSKAKPETLVLSSHLSVLLPLSVKLHWHLCLLSHPLSTIPFLTSTSIIPLNLLFSRPLIRSTLLDPRVHSSVLIFMTQAAFNPTQLKLTNSLLLPGTLSPLGLLSITLAQLLSVALVLSPNPLLSS